jgi:peptidoglycan/xylan/chitin deacetylase (PgdA/CDA1 family)
MVLPILFLSIFLAVVIFLTVQYSIFMPSVKGIPILMYHQVKPFTNTRLCISPDKLETQFLYLISNGYSCVKLGELTDSKKVFPKRSFVLTFDDAYLNNLEYLYPLLVKHNLHATIMLPVKYLGKENEWDGSGEKIMTIGQLKSMNQQYISFGLHTYNHKNLRHATLEEVKAEIVNSSDFLTESQISYLPVLAYPYGGYPKEKKQMAAFFTVLEKNGIKLGLRIGNRINRWPLKNNFLVKRIDIRGIDSMWEFKTKIKKGRVKMF